MNPKSFIPSAVAILFLELLAEPCLWAGGVVNSCTQSDLASALSGGGTVTFACHGTIILSNTITISQDTLLDGSGHAVTVSGNHAVRVFNIDPGVKLALVQLTIANGLQASTNSNYGGGIFNNGEISLRRIARSLATRPDKRACMSMPLAERCIAPTEL